MRKCFLLCAVVFVCLSVNSQSGVSISVPASTPDASAILDIKSTSKGLLIPRMTSAERTAIASPATGLFVYQTDSPAGLWFYNGTTWQQAGGDNLGNSLLTQNLKTVGNYISKGGTNLGLQMLDSGAFRIVTINNDGGFTGSTGERFRFDAWGGFLAKSMIGVGQEITSGAGDKLFWNSFRAAFRAGGIDGTQWDQNNMGFYSAGFGYNTIPQGNYSFASGYLSRALQSYATGMGYSCTADGVGAVALGYRCTADGDYSVAIGQRAATRGFNGTLVLSDQSSTDSTKATANNQFTSRYSGGYRLLSNAIMTVGVQVTAGGNSWSAISDSTKKENYQPASTEYFLNKLSHLKLGSWNYKGQDSKTFRHYGPMAQEIFAAFGNDKYGTIGCDTLLASADMDGIMMIMLQGLEKRSREQASEIDRLKDENAALKKQLEKLNNLEAEVKKLMAATATK